ncbi:DUF7594 domain-containing protein [Cerasicoccus frondis]|uniref:CBM96 family carbohydrate-binding protein n=1 Tax=Cerasicoccus frondis TaxID=490090 RepID=UPI0028529C9B|nr:DNRLRE domain-containing protein [Cerasicoccus frondis]
MITTTPLPRRLARLFAGALCLVFGSSLTATTYSLSPLEDAYVRDGAYADDTLGLSDPDILLVKIAATDYNRRAYLRFDLRGVNGTVSDAKLRLKVKGLNAGAKNSLRPVDDDTWDEDEITWNNKPAFGSSLGTKDVPAVGEWIEWDITSHINTMVANDEVYASFVIVSNTGAYNLLAKYYSSEASTADRPELEVTFSPIYDAPYDLTKFQSSVADCKLQAPGSTPPAVNQGEFADFADWFFYLDGNDYMTFTMEGYANRCELRNLTEWPTNTSTAARMIAELRIPAITSTDLEQFTFMQVHASDSVDGPLLRLNWRDSRDGYDDHIWATLRTSVDPKESTIYHLGPRPDSLTDIEVKVQNSQLSIIIDGTTVLNNVDISHWNGFSNYFKAGAYINSPGYATTQFNSLTFITP